MILAIDTSKYEDRPMNYPLIASQGVDLACTKATQGDYYTDLLVVYHNLEAKKAKIKDGTFHFHDPDKKYSPEGQVIFYFDYLKKVGLMPSFHCLDIEREWEWVYRAFKTGKKAKKEWVQTRIDGSELNARVHRSWDYWKAECVKRGTPYLLYTRRSWIDEYCPKMFEWVKDEPLWLAQYPDDHVRTSMTEVQQALYFAEVEKLSKTWVNLKGLNNVLLWQFCQYYQTTGYGNPTDLSLVFSKVKLDDWYNKTGPVVVPDPGVEPLTLTTLEKRVVRLEKILIP